MEDWNKLTVPQLKTSCTERGLDVSGKKADLVQRLEAYAEENKGETAVADNGDVVEVKDDEPTEEETTEQTEETGDSKDQAEEDSAEKEEKDVEDVIDAIDDIIEEEKKEGEENGEENADEKKEGDAEGDKKETKEEEKKKDPPPKTFVKVPTKRNARTEVLSDLRTRSIVIGPLVFDDVKNEKVQEIFQKADKWSVNFEGETGNARLKLKDFEAAKELVESITAEPFKEDLVVKQLTKEIDENVTLESIVKGETDKKAEAFELRMLYLHNVPESATEDALKELVPEAITAIIPRDDERKLKGYAYLEFEAVKNMEEFIKKVDNLSLEGNKMTLHNLPNFIPDDRRNQGRFQGNYNRNQNYGNRRFDNQRGGYQRGGRGGNYPNRNQYDRGDRWGNQGGRNQGGAGGAQAVDLLMGISQMLRTQQGGGGGGGYEQRGYGQQRGYDNYGARDGGYQQDNWGRKRRFDDGGYNQGGGYGGGNKRFNTGRRY